MTWEEDPYGLDYPLKVVDTKKRKIGA